MQEGFVFLLRILESHLMTRRIIDDSRVISVKLDATSNVFHCHRGRELDIPVFADSFRIAPFCIDILCYDLEVFLIPLSFLMRANQDSASFPQETFDPRDLSCEPWKVILENPMPFLHIVGIGFPTRRVIHIRDYGHVKIVLKRTGIRPDDLWNLLSRGFPPGAATLFGLLRWDPLFVFPLEIFIPIQHIRLLIVFSILCILFQQMELMLCRIMCHLYNISISL
jgi:hypothetical protein